MNLPNTLSPHSDWPSYRLDARNELLARWRTPAFTLPTLLLPVMFYLFFSGMTHAPDPPQAARWMLANYVVFGVMAPALFGFGVSVAMERSLGLLRLRRALPLPLGSYLFGKLAAALVFGAVVTLLMSVAAAAVRHVSLQPLQWLSLFGVGLFGTLTFCPIGLLIGASVGGNIAPTIANMVYLPMSIISGLWMPLTMLPAVFTTIAPLWPAWHLAQLAQLAAGNPMQGSLSSHVLALALTIALFLWLAAIRLRRAQD